MTYLEAVDYLVNSLPDFQKYGQAALNYELEKIKKLLEFLDNPHLKIKCVHIAGTNGKGSSSHMIASVLQSANYKTGLYTSPHLKRFTERIRIDGVEISESCIIDFVGKNKSILDELRPSFFEMTTALAFYHFAQQKVDFAVIEVGLGGRLDCTNVITPLVSLITNISYDHMAILGNTLPLIASEKAGIIKPGIPVVISENQEEINEVFIEKCIETKSSLYFATDEYQCLMPSFGCFEIYKNEKLFMRLIPELKSRYQSKNLPGVIKVLDLLRSMGVTMTLEQIEHGLSNTVRNTGLKGRWQQVHDQPMVICDTAHNEAGITEALQQAMALAPPCLFIITGIVVDKEVERILALFPKTAFFLFCSGSNPRMMSSSDLQEKATKLGLVGGAYNNVNQALGEALEMAKEKDLILILGSNFLIAEVDLL